jgi:hypothetical protein
VHDLEDVNLGHLYGLDWMDSLSGIHIRKSACFSSVSHSFHVVTGTDTPYTFHLTSPRPVP